MPPSLRTTVILLLFGLLLAAGYTTAAQENPTMKASFDCTKAASPVEHLICSDETLSMLDKEMTALFTAARNAAENEEARQSQLKEQRAWLKARLTTCKIPSPGALPDDTAAMRACLIDEVHKRNEILAAAIKKKPPQVVSEAAAFDSGTTAANTELKIVRISANIPPMNEVVDVDPFQRKMIKCKLTAGKVPIDRLIEKGLIAFRVTASDEVDRDGVTHQLLVSKRKNLDVGANYGTTTEGAVQETLLFPENIRTDVGDVTVSLSPTVIGDLEGAFRFMKQYPYECWEQKLSRAVMAASYQALKPYLAADFTWEGTNGIVAEVLNTAKDFQAPTAA